MVGEIEKVVGECWFLDVGQGTCSAILLGDGRAILIDCGPASTNIPLQLLKRYVHTIEVLIISHNDTDHDGGTAKIIQNYPKAIKNIYFLKDRPAEEIKIYKLLWHERRNGKLLNMPKRLECDDRPRTIYRDRERGIRLDIMYPTMMDNFGSEEMGNANRTSGILRLFCGKRSILFSGDATMESWELLSTRFPDKMPVKCDIMTIPHHGGRLLDKGTKETNEEYERRLLDDMGRLYSRIVRPKIGIISVGTSNQHGHPLPATIESLRNSRVCVICTQITPQCGDNLEAIRPGVIEPRSPSQSSREKRVTKSGKSKDIGCAGSIVAEISSHEIRTSLLQEHQVSISQNSSSADFHPMCRREGHPDK